MERLPKNISIFQMFVSTQHFKNRKTRLLRYLIVLSQSHFHTLWAEVFILAHHGCVYQFGPVA
ncbi:hypothetical protein JL49_24570 [Pseudoalteromonas luteoviolacea]|nr:hypothetical protein JL49_24570 [Pseudoalteromonas luteoviolacea]